MSEHSRDSESTGDENAEKKQKMSLAAGGLQLLLCSGWPWCWRRVDLKLFALTVRN